jgi:hypothetical protein
MRRTVARLAALVAITFAGCQLPLGPWGGPAYEVDTTKAGSDESSISLRNDAQFWNGQPMDCRTRR